MAYDPNVLRRASARLEGRSAAARMSVSCSGGRPMPKSPGWLNWTGVFRAPWPNW